MAETKLTAAQEEELSALVWMTNGQHKTSFIHRSHWRGLYQPLVQRGLVNWKPHPTMGPEFRETRPTAKGRELLRRNKDTSHD